MTANTSLLLTVPDYPNLRASLVTFLKSQTQFTDYNFEGSNMAVLIDLLAYNTYQSAFLTNMVASEMFLDTAQLYPSVVSRAKELGYTARSTRSSRAVINIQINPSDAPGVITIPSGTPFGTSMGNQSFNFYTDQAYLITVANNAYIANNVEIFEGFPVQDVFTANGSTTNQTFTLSNANADTSTISVYVTENGPEQEFTPTSSIVGLDSNSKVFFTQQDFKLNYQIEFGDGVTGYNPGAGAIVRVTYMSTTGPNPNGANTFVNAATIAGYANVVVTTVAPAIGGDVAESIESIKYYAPLKAQTLNRAVVAGDYEILLKDQFPEIKAIHAFGGENLNPPAYGQIVIVVLIDGIDNGLPQTKVAEYTQFINTKNQTLITPMFLAPSYLTVRVTSKVFYDYTQTSLGANDIKALVVKALTDYNTNSLQVFDTTLRYSKLTGAIDDANPAINSNETDLQLVAELNLVQLANNAAQTISFYNPVLDDDGVTSDPFTFNNSLCRIASKSDGGLYITTSLTGDDENIMIVKQVGTIDFDNGIAIVFPISFDQVFSGGINLYATPVNKDIQVVQNTLVNIDFDHLNITVTPQVWNKR